jgi:hypothetical protein
MMKNNCCRLENLRHVLKAGKINFSGPIFWPKQVLFALICWFR